MKCYLVALMCCLQTVCLQAQTSSRGELLAQFRRFDRNGDGKVTPAEFPRPLIFRRLDRNADGVITLEEVTRRRLGTLRENTPRDADAPDEPAAAAEVIRTLDIAYGDHEAQRLDIYQPDDSDAAQKRPIMVYVHGGGWRKGDKARVGEKVDFFCGNGWLFVSINYRLLPEGQHPANVQDVARALAWVHENAGTYGADATQLFLMGHSAGAHLVALVATDERPLKAAGKDLSILRGVVPLDTKAYDLVELTKTRGPDFYQRVFGDDAEVLQDASPAHHVAAGKSIPPFLICYSRGMGALTDPQRAACAHAFARRLKDAGVKAEVVDASDRNHGEINAWFGRSDDRVTKRARAFFATHRPHAPDVQESAR